MLSSGAKIIQGVPDRESIGSRQKYNHFNELGRFDRLYNKRIDFDSMIARQAGETRD